MAAAIDKEKYIGCSQCENVCPAGAIKHKNNKVNFDEVELYD
jgi:formate hydrogenlyase subunit 6/NADH:ubiquinone oxidoreductase subunit I